MDNQQPLHDPVEEEPRPSLATQELGRDLRTAFQSPEPDRSPPDSPVIPARRSIFDVPSGPYGAAFLQSGRFLSDSESSDSTDSLPPEQVRLGERAPLPDLEGNVWADDDPFNPRGGDYQWPELTPVDRQIMGEPRA